MVVQFKLLLVFMIVSMVFISCHRDYHREHHQSDHYDRIVTELERELDLSEDQTAKVGAIVQDMMNEKEQFRAVRNELYDSVIMYSAADKPDSVQLEQLLTVNSEKINKAIRACVDKFSQLRQILTDEQKEKFTAYIAYLESHRSRKFK
jgi:Spy/CpxP family protein refolding chaperone